ncbi:MAG: DinB family protein [Bacteroidales bacterium]
MAYTHIEDGILEGLDLWEARLLDLPEERIRDFRNGQNRNIREILGHMVDSASNNLHRIVHLQHRESPLEFPNYASQGNNDRWIAIQNYRDEDWFDLVQLWKYAHLHLVHVIRNVEPSNVTRAWNSGPDHGLVTLNDMIVDFLRHFRLHLDEIRDLMNA